MKRVPVPALVLGVLGVVPFVSLAIASHAGRDPWTGAAAQAALYYGAVILSFLGGCRWGFACAGLGRGPGWRPLLVAIAPPLLAWGAALAGGKPGLLLLAGAMLLLFAADESLVRTGGAPDWWAVLRAPLSVISGAALFAAGIA